jgi:hypothetical protein
MRSALLGVIVAVAFAGAASAADVAGTYNYNGTDTDGSKYSEGGTLTVKAEKSGAYEVKWDGGDYVGIGQVSGNLFAVAAVAEKKNTIMLMEIAPDGSLSGKWWRRNDPGSKGTEVWKKK